MALYIFSKRLVWHKAAIMLTVELTQKSVFGRLVNVSAQRVLLSAIGWLLNLAIDHHLMDYLMSNICPLGQKIMRDQQKDRLRFGLIRLLKKVDNDIVYT